MDLIYIDEQVWGPLVAKGCKAPNRGFGKVQAQGSQGGHAPAPVISGGKMCIFHRRAQHPDMKYNVCKSFNCRCGEYGNASPFMSTELPKPMEISRRTGAPKLAGTMRGPGLWLL